MTDINIAICLLAILVSCMGMFAIIISKLGKIEKHIHSTEKVNDKKTDA